MEMAPWYYVNATRERQGPVPADELRALHTAGAINARSLVWRQGMAQWQPLEQVAGELGIALAASPLPSAPDSALRATVTSAAAAATRPTREEPRFGDDPVGAEPAHADRARERALSDAYAASASDASALGAVDAQDVVDAGFWRRAAALMIDGLILTVAVYAIVFVMLIVAGLGAGGIMTMFQAGAGGGAPEGPLLFVFIVGFYVLPFLMRWAYFTFFTASEWQGTPGKRAVGIKVVDLEGHRIGKGRATGRWFAAALSYLTLYIGFLMAAFTDRKMALHDYVASTRVVDRWAYTANPERQQRGLGGCAIAALVGGGLLFLVFIAAMIAAVSLPAYQDYTQRAQLAQVVAEGRSMTVAAEEFISNTSRCPQDLEEIGLEVPVNPLVAEAAIGETEAGACTLEFQLRGGSTMTPLDGEYLWFERGDGGGWVCSGSLPDADLPAGCRG